MSNVSRAADAALSQGCDSPGAGLRGERSRPQVLAEIAKHILQPRYNNPLCCPGTFPLLSRGAVLTFTCCAPNPHGTPELCSPEGPKGHRTGKILLPWKLRGKVSARARAGSSDLLLVD